MARHLLLTPGADAIGRHEMKDAVLRRRRRGWAPRVVDLRNQPSMFAPPKESPLTAVVVDLTGVPVRIWASTLVGLRAQASEIRFSGMCPYCGRRAPGVAGCTHNCMLKHWATVGERQRSSGEQIPLAEWVDRTCDECGVDLSRWSLGEVVPGRCESCIPLRIEAQALRTRESNRRADRKRRANFQGQRGRYSDNAIFERDEWLCHLCGGETKRGAVWPDPLAPTIDHLVPLSLQGDDTEENVATAHWKCNRDKRNRFISVRVDGQRITTARYHGRRVA